MIDPSLTPTRLLREARAPLTIHAPLAPSPTRAIEVCRRVAALGLWALAQLVTARWNRRRFGVRLRSTFEELGGLWIHAGHLLSLRIDIFSREVCEELATLHARQFGFPPAEARRLLEAELGAPINQYFDEFDEIPFALAPVAQVHRARLRHEQTYVAVKIQQPRIEAVFAQDLKHISWLVTLVHRLGIRRHLMWDVALEELREQSTRQLNFQYEASAIRRMRARLRQRRIMVPKLFKRYSTRRVLVTEFIHASLMIDLLNAGTDPARVDAWLNANNIEPKRLARRLLFSTYRQIFEHNLYHGNPSPQHVVLLRDSHAALLEFTNTTFTEREYLDKFRLFIKALAMRDYAKAADVSFMLCASLPNIDTEMVKEELVRALRAWATRTLVKELPYREKSLDNALVETLSVLVRYRCTMTWDGLRIRRALTHLDQSLAVLYPDANYTKILQQYCRQADRRAIDALAGPELVRRSIGSFLTALDIQERVNEYTMFQGALVRRHAQVFKGTTTKVAAVFMAIVGEISLLLGLTGALAAVVFANQRYPAAVRSVIGPQLSSIVDRIPHLDGPIWLIVFGVLGYGAWSLASLRRRLQERDVRAHERVAAV
jgi:ubiquinone biosynthesis protein